MEGPGVSLHGNTANQPIYEAFPWRKAHAQLGCVMQAKSYNVEINYINTNQQKCTEINQFITMQILAILRIFKKLTSISEN
jgi:argininosuccinate lyase